MKSRIILLIALLLALKVNAQEGINFIDLAEKDLGQVLKLSKEQKKNVFILFTLDVCSPCIKMRKEVYPDNEVSDFFNGNFICAKSMRRTEDEIVKTEKYQSFKKKDIELRNKYGIAGNPSFLVLDENGDIIHRSPRLSDSGFKDKFALIQFGKDALSDDKSYTALKAKIERGDFSFETISSILKCLIPVVLNYLDNNSYDCEAQEILDKYFATQSESDLVSENNWYILNNHVDNPFTEPFQYLLNNQDIFYNKYGKEAVDKRIFQVLRWYGYYGSLDRCKYAEKEIKALKYPQVEALVIHEKASSKRDDLNKFAKNINKVYTNFYHVFYSEINNRSWIIYEASKQENSKINSETLDIASNWMKLVNSYTENAHYQDTYAHILYQQGNKDLAIIAQKKAIEIAKLHNYEEKAIDSYKRSLEKMKK